MRPLYPAIRRGLAATVLALGLHASAACAQPATPTAAPAEDSSPAFPPGTIDVSVAAGGAWGVPAFGYGIENSFVLTAVSASRVLTAVRGRGPLRGQFAWGIEVVPLLAQYRPERVLGIGVRPLLWRWTMLPRGRWTPFSELGGGLLWTDAPLPPDTTRANYTAHVAFGLRLPLAPRRAALVSYRFEHISNGNRASTNPSLNAHAIVAGVSWLRSGR